METSVASDFLDKLVFISNSIPKSGSTLLFSLQQEFLLRLAGKSEQDFSVLANLGVNVDAGFVSKPFLGPLMDVLESGELCGGPFILKIHFPLNERVSRLLLESKDLHMSLAIRDPVQVFMSARDNFKKTGEFPEFADTDAGCELISNFFGKIYKSVARLPSSACVPIVRYETIVSDPLEALLSSFGPALLRRIFLKIAEDYTDLQRANILSSNRLNIGIVNRLENFQDEDLLDKLTVLLAATREEFGY